MKAAKKLKYLFLLPILLTLSSCDMGSFGDGSFGEGIGEKLFPNIWAFLIQLFALIILLVVVIFFAYKPVKAFMEKRKELLNNEVNETHSLNKKAKANLDESQSNLAKSRKEATNIVNEAELTASKRKDEILEEANLEINQNRQKALDDIKKAKEEAKVALQKEIVDVALDASSKILEREVKASDNTKIVEDFVKDLEKK